MLKKSRRRLRIHTPQSRKQQFHKKAMISDSVEESKSESISDLIDLGHDHDRHRDADDETLEGRACKFCFSEESIGEWLCPCMCSGTIKWVHASCFERWLRNAPLGQQNQCITCRYVYKKRWELKPLDEWCCPPLKLSTWDLLEIFLDAYSTYRLLRGFYKTLVGQRSLLAQMAHILFWKTFIATDRRMNYYLSLGRLLASSAFHITVKNAQ
uniref:RING-CH-type domain-containing protein n=1 Tax=Ascaris lumbricoides TaxID=6252 RepID=A0A0M3HZG6_ASCLU